MTLSEIIGHQQLRGLLARAVARASLPPSLLFVGPEGVGKHLSALALAKLLNCESSSHRAGPRGESGPPPAEGGDACGTCQSCARISRGVHPDVLELAPGETGSIKVEQVREVIEKSGYRPFEGRRRVVIVDPADALGADAQNALLKTLEEPPPASVFVLVSARPDALLPTVRSRCSRLRFGRLTVGEIAAVLEASHQYTATDARAAAAVADGSLGRALVSQSSEVTEARAQALQALAGARRADPRGRLELARDLAARKGATGSDRDALRLRLHVMASLLRDLVLMTTRPDVGRLSHADLAPDLARLTSAYDGPRALRAFWAVDRALGALVERNASPKIVADWVAFQL